MTPQTFGQLSDGRTVHQVTLQNRSLSVGLLTLGASLQHLKFEDDPMILGSDHLADYLGPMQYFGAIVGRVANRIAGASCFIAGKQISLDANEEGEVCLHGGRDGASQQLWELSEADDTHAIFSLTLPDGHMGFPGNLNVQARYELRDTTLRLELTAKSDAETLCNFAPHAYWNLAGAPTTDAHELQISAQEYLPVDAKNVPTGEIAKVKETAFDFTKPRAIDGAELDHNFCLSNTRQTLRPIVRLTNPESGVALDVSSTETGVQIYDGRHIGRAGVAIEPQVWPDAINQKGFPNMILRPGETYRSVTEFSLSKRAHS